MPETVHTPGPLRRLLFLLAFSNLWIAATAAGFAYASAVLAGWSPGWELALLPGLSMFAVYTFDKVLGYDPVSDPENDPERSAFIERWGRPLLVLAATGLVAGGALAMRSGGWLALGLFLLPIVVGALYGLKVLPRSFRYRRLKDVTGVKNLTVGLTWGACSALLPAALLGTWGREAWLAAGWAALHMTINTTYFDMGDVKGDRAEGTPTLPVVIGFGRTRALLIALTAGGWVATSVAAAAGLFPPW